MDKVIASQKKTIRFRSQTNSSAENKKVEDNLLDILNLVNNNNKINKELKEIQNIIHIENVYNNIGVQRLQNKIRELEGIIRNATSGNKMKEKIVFPHQCRIESKEAISANIDIENNCITLPYVASTSKLTVYDEVLDRIFIPEGLKIKTKVLNAVGIEDIQENDPYNFIREDSNYWYQKVVATKDVGEIETLIEIELPDTIISNRDVNTIIINPFPAKSMDLMSVKYKLYGDWNDVGGLSTHIESVENAINGVKRDIIPSCPNIMLSFKDVSAKKIRLIFRQREYTKENDRNIFYIGAKSIKILNRRYDRNIGTFYVNVEFDKNGLNTINDIKTILNNSQEIKENTIQYEFYKLDEFNVPSRIAESFPFSINNGKLMIKCNIYKSSITPNIAQLRLIYND